MRQSVQKYSESEMLNLLHEAHIRPSIHRLAVMGYVANAKTHPTADEIYARILEDFPNVSRTTVYNCLHTLTDAGLLRELDIERGSARYDMGRQIPHAHFTCSRCGRIFDVPLPPHIEATIAPGFITQCTELHFKGICPDCK